MVLNEEDTKKLDRNEKPACSVGCAMQMCMNDKVQLYWEKKWVKCSKKEGYTDRHVMCMVENGCIKKCWWSLQEESQENIGQSSEDWYQALKL